MELCLILIYSVRQKQKNVHGVLRQSHQRLISHGSRLATTLSLTLSLLYKHKSERDIVGNVFSLFFCRMEPLTHTNTLLVFNPRPPIIRYITDFPSSLSQAQTVYINVCNKPHRRTRGRLSNIKMFVALPVADHPSHLECSFHIYRSEETCDRLFCALFLQRVLSKVIFDQPKQDAR